MLTYRFTSYETHVGLDTLSDTISDVEQKTFVLCRALENRGNR